MCLVASWSAHTLKDNNMVIVCIILWTLTEFFMLPCNKYQWIIYFTPMKSVHFLNWDPAWENRAYVHKILTSLWALKLHNFVLKHSLSIKLLLLWHTTGNFMQFIELLTQKVRYTELCQGANVMHISPVFSCQVTNVFWLQQQVTMYIQN